MQQNSLWEKYVEDMEVKYPEVSKKIIREIVENIPGKIDTKEYELAFVVAQKLGLSNSYFSQVLKRETDIKAHIIKQGTFLYVKLDCEIKKLLDDDFICMKIEKNEEHSFDHVIYLTKNTLLGFYK